MADLKDLASLLGVTSTAKEQPTDNRKRGYDGNVVRLKVRTEKRRGKVVTIAQGFQSHPKELHDLLALLKKTLGTGGQVTDNALELQGDHVERISAILLEHGWAIHKK